MDGHHDDDDDVIGGSREGNGYRQHQKNKNYSSRKGPISRPWTSKMNYSPSSSTTIWNDHQRTMLATEDSRLNNNATATLLLDRPRMTVAWGKLSSCFCVRGGGGGSSSSKKRPEDHNHHHSDGNGNMQKGNRNSYYSNNSNGNNSNHCSKKEGYKERQQQQHLLQNPFSNLTGVLRRHSSLTLMSGVVGEAIEGLNSPDHSSDNQEQRDPHNHRGGRQQHHQNHNNNGRHQHDDSGSLSDFTQSETSSYLAFSDDDDDDDYGAAAEALVLRPRIQGLGPRGVPSPPGLNETHSMEAAKSAPMMPTQEVLPGSGFGIGFTGGVGGGSGGYSFDNATISSAPGKQSSPPLSKTPPSQRITRPPVIAARSRSAGLPPLNPSSSFGGGGNSSSNNITSLLLTSQEPSFTRRQRTDTGDFTRTSGTTNTSRHRRKDPFTFSDRSITEIWLGDKNGSGAGVGGAERHVGGGGGEMSTPPLPPSYVSFPYDPCWPAAENGVIPHINNCGQFPITAAVVPNQGGLLPPPPPPPSSNDVVVGWNGSFASSFDDGEIVQEMYAGMPSIPGGVDDGGEQSDENSGSPFAGLDRKVDDISKLDNSKYLPKRPSSLSPGNDLSGGDSTLYYTQQQQHYHHQQQQAMKGSEKKKLRQNDVTPTREGSLTGYLRKNPNLDASTKGQLVLSGWVAILFGTATELRLMKQQEQERDSPATTTNFNLSSSDMYYLRVVVLDGQASLLLNKSNNIHTDGSSNSFDQSYVIERDWVIETFEVAKHIGRAIVIHGGVSTTSTVTATKTTPSSMLVLPVALADCFITESGDLVSEKSFFARRDRLFAHPNDYPPDEQLDSAMHLVFSIDSLVKRHGPCL